MGDLIERALVAASVGEPRVVRALIAARLSQLQRDGRQGIGIDTQDEKSRDFCEREGYAVVDVVADTKSGTVAPWDRKNLKPWVTEPEKMRLYDVIVAYKTDRLSRGTQEDFTRIEYWATQNHKRLIIVDGPQYPAREGDKFQSDYWQWHAEKMTARKEWENDRERTLRATDKLRSEHKFVGRIPWGFVTEGPKYGKYLVPTDLGRKYIPEIYDRVIDGHSLADICFWLDSLHIKQKRDPETGEMVDAPWWPAKLAELIRNPVYRGRYWMTRIEKDPETGRIAWSEKWEHSCDPLIDARRFRQANEALVNREKRGPKGDPATRAMLRGAIKCPSCEGSSMNRIPSRGSTKNGGTGTLLYYRCTGTGSQPKGCGNMVRMEAVDAAVNEIIAASFKIPVKMYVLIRGTDYTEELKEIKLRMRELDPDTMSDPEYDAEMARLRVERDRLQTLDEVPDEWREAETDELYSDVYAALPEWERGAWLKSKKFTVTASKTNVTVTLGNIRITKRLP